MSVSSPRPSAALPYLLLLPSVAYLVIFFASPMVQAFGLAFTSTTGEWGLTSLSAMVSDDRFWPAVWTTLILLVVLLPIQLALALAMSMIITGRLRGRGFWLYVFLLPLGVSELGAGILWYSIFVEQGWLNTVLQGVGLIDRPVIWLDYREPWRVIGTIVVAEAWRSTSLLVIILVGGLRQIPKDYLEAADVFHAGPWQRMRHVVLPLLRPTIRTALIVRVVLAFEVFATVIALGGTATDTLATQANRAYTEFQDAHLASAYGLVILVVSLVAVGLVLAALPARKERGE
ncbi:carbohydrate ABC transporter permease [Pseudonocardia sp. WMMC193]|uniref:carbohydrate ABC transporter permease n=1 Tax=Pseudonocardia sp. WMMC193 TaxID=2911965 RepID=UPI001F3D0EDE|nr:sugar ABC transporter permease [Pseudonocardia sp. WMMC193]MCF7549050.1 sugar ABC transporter permease [Pseudonocardia sp. WMMC193]